MNPLFRSLALTLALGGMLLRAALPAGWMPNLDGPSGAPFEICSVDGLHHAPAQEPGHHPVDDRNTTCAFAAAAHLAPPQIASVLLQPVTYSSFAPDIDAQRAGTDPYEPGHAPRGPPLSI